MALAPPIPERDRLYCRFALVTDSAVVAAWAQIHDATPPGWYVGRPGFEVRRTHALIRILR